MAEEGLKVTVGASLDRSTLTVFAQMAEAAKRASAQIAQYEKRAVDEGSKAATAAAKATEAAERTKTREVEREAKKRAQAERDAIRTVEREQSRALSNKMAIDRQRSRAVMQALRDEAREEKRISEQKIRDSKLREASEHRDRQAFDRQAGQGLRTGLSMAGRGIRFAAGVGRDILQGVGVDTSFQSMVRKNVDLEQMATDLSNQGFMPGKAGSAGMRQDPRLLMQESFNVGNKTGIGANEVMGGMGEFVKLTGDLETARSLMERLAILSKATGTSLEDMSAAAGNVSNALGDVPDKAKMIDEVMRQIAGQGKVGAVEIRDLATQMGKVAAFAPLMAGGTAQNIQTFGGIAQMARKSGATSATQAAQSVVALMAQFNKGKRLEAMQSYGVSATDEKTGKIRNIEEMLPQIFAAAARRHGGVGQSFRVGMTSMIQDQQAQRASRGYQAAFQEAYIGAGGTNEQKIQAGVDAVKAAFEDMRKAAVREAELKESFSAAMETTKSKSEQWNNAIQAATLELQDKFMPLLPVLVDAFTGLLGAVKGVVDFLRDAGLIKSDSKAAQNAAHGSKAMVLTGQQLEEGLKKGELTQAQVDQAGALVKKQRADLDEAKKQAASAGQHGAISRSVRGIFSNMHEALPTDMGGGGASMQLFPLFAALGIGGKGKNAYSQGEALDQLDQGGMMPGEAAEDRLKAMEQLLADIKGGTLSVHIKADDTKANGPNADGGESSLPPTE